VLSGSEEEGKRLRKLARKLKLPIKDIAGQTDLRTLAAVLSLARVVVANSTGPLHLAAAVGTRVVGLYPSRKAMSPRRWGPVGEPHRVMQPDSIECHCPPRGCQCMEKITVDQVAEEVLSLYNLQQVS
jgi:ADP-heptose:LPS heptosyltransferase